ncbi:hypothetical protein [Streptosporangium longisporum]|uniref:Uncharacterized protein n=1 Tax=Streptosporangium longisporum TaxID=46187 RepID=A0ABN3Y186_9ACTN
MLACTALLAAAVACGGERPAPRTDGAPPTQERSPAPGPAAEKSSKTPGDASGPSDGPRGSDIESSDPDHFEAEITLADGRRVAMHYGRRRGLFEQHHVPGHGWTRPRLIYRTETDACQGIELRAVGGTVTAIANFAPYCADGEPPMESVAAVGVGDLSRWDHHLTRSFDGWERVTVTDGGERAVFSSRSLKWHSSLVWTLKDGFAEPVDKRVG